MTLFNVIFYERRIMFDTWFYIALPFTVPIGWLLSNMVCDTSDIVVDIIDCLTKRRNI